MILAILLMTTSGAVDTTAEQLDLAQRTGRYLCDWRVAAGLVGAKVPELEICAQMPDDRLEIMWAINGWWRYWYKFDVPLAERMRKRFDHDFASATATADVVGLFRAEIEAVELREWKKLEPARAAIATADHPYAGMWSRDGCRSILSLTITPANEPGLYAFTFCGKNGCADPGLIRPNSRIVGDPDFRSIKKDTFQMRGLDGYKKWARCPVLQADGAGTPDATEEPEK
jgi:hypothetical protein